MKKAIIILVILLVGGAWTVNKFVSRASKSSDEEARFLSYAADYDNAAETFITVHAKSEHDDAFAASYRMWKLTPVSEIDLESHFDEKTYYLTLGRILDAKAKSAGQVDAHNALIDIGKFYGMTPTAKDPATTPQPKVNTAATGAGPLGKSALGDKRTVPGGSRHRYNR